MKINFIIALLLVFFLQTVKVSAQNYPHSKEKKVSGKFTVTNADKLIISNIYGDITINIWDKNEITVDITIKAFAKKENRAQEILDNITIDEKNNLQGGHQLSYKTMHSGTTFLNDEKMQINYVVNMPKKNAIDITNKFGDVSLDDFEGDMRMEISYGNLTTQKISGNKKHIKVGFGNASIASIETGKIDASYSNVTINTAQNIDLKNEFGETKITSVQVLETNQRYGDLEIGSVSEITGSVGFADIDIDKVAKMVDLRLEYCGKADFGIIEAGVNMVDINASFSDLFFKMDKANLAIDITSKFGDVDNDVKSIELTSSSPKNDRFTATHKGKAGKGEGTMSLNINYGDVNFD